jgi:hypothetical protein
VAPAAEAVTVAGEGAAAAETATAAARGTSVLGALEAEGLVLGGIAVTGAAITGAILLYAPSTGEYTGPPVRLPGADGAPRVDAPSGDSGAIRVDPDFVTPRVAPGAPGLVAPVIDPSSGAVAYLASTLATTDSVTVTGSSATERARAYETGVRDLYGGATYPDREYVAIVDGRVVRGVADGVTIVNDRPTAVEAKYTDGWASSPFNPDSVIGGAPWAAEERGRMLEQAAKYSSGFAGGVNYHTNSPDLAAYYTQKFYDSGITNFRFVITPATRGTR